MKKALSIIEIGSIVRTKKGDRFNKFAKEENLKVLFFTDGNYKRRATCLKPNGKKTSFILENLYLVK